MNPIDCYNEIVTEKKDGRYKKAPTFEERLKWRRGWFLKDEKRKANDHASYLKRKEAKKLLKEQNHIPHDTTKHN